MNICNYLLLLNDDDDDDDDDNSISNNNSYWHELEAVNDLELVDAFAGHVPDLKDRCLHALCVCVCVYVCVCV